MKYIQYTYVDAVTGISIAAQPAANGPVNPDVKGLDFVWARQSAYPTNVPEFFGACDDDADLFVDGVVKAIGESKFGQLQAQEMLARAEIATERLKMAGIEILETMCSATKDDQNGLTAIAMGVTLARMSATTLPDTVFQFSNGNVLTITDANFSAVYAAWVPFRQSFFTAL